MKLNTATIFKAGLLVVFVAAAFLTAIVAYGKTRDFVSHYQMTQLEGFAIQNGTTATANVLGTPAPTETPQVLLGPTPQPWDGASRVNLLVVGLDYRDWEAGSGAPRTDTMIVFTVDPLTGIAGVLNVPRDLWVSIPGFGYGKINTAYSLGESWRMPGGGLALAAKTVELLLGVPIHYYAQVDFYVFEKFIDEIDGILINVPYEIKIDPIGEGNTIVLQPGEQRLYGPEALAYARARYTDGGDFDRADRQQQVIMAIKRRALKVNVLPRLIASAPELYREFSEGIRTNLSLEQAIQFAWLAQGITQENVVLRTIGKEQVNFAKSPDGTQDILKPLPDAIRKLRDEVFATAAVSPLATSTDAAGLMAAEQARLSVLNGTFIEGLATSTQAYLQSLGAQVVSTGNAAEAPAYTKITDYTGNPYTLRYLVDLMKINPNYIYYRYDPASAVDVEIILGADWANSNPMP